MVLNKDLPEWPQWHEKRSSVDGVETFWIRTRVGETVYGARFIVDALEQTAILAGLLVQQRRWEALAAIRTKIHGVAV